MYHFIVCIKQVPDTTEVKIDPVTNTLIRKGVPSIVNPFDRSALEMALELRDQVDAKVTVVCMGPPQANDAIRECLTMGADDAVLVSGREFGGADTLATSYALSGVMRTFKDADIIFCGKQAIDGDTAQVGPEIAEHMGIPQITLAKNIAINGKKVSVQRELEEETETVEASMPLVITVGKNDAKPRYGNIARFLMVNEMQIPVLTGADLDVDPQRLGLNGSPTKVKRIFSPEKQKRGTRVENVPASEMAETVYNVLSGAGLAQ